MILLGHVAQEYHAQSGFNRRYDHLDSMWSQGALGIEKHPDGYLVALVTQYSDTGQITNMRASMLIDQYGIKIWDKLYYLYYTSSYIGWANGLNRTADGGYIIGGSRDTINQLNYADLVRLDPDGDTLWTRQWGDGDADWIGYNAIECLDGGFLIVGITGATGFIDGFAIKTDSLGNEEWVETYGGGALWDGFVAVAQLPDTGFYLGGQKDISDTNPNLWVVRTDKSGAIIWQRNWGSAYRDPNAHLCATFDGHCAVAAFLGYAPDYSLTRPYIAKLDSSDGSFIWEHEYGGIAGTTGFFTVKECTNTDLIAAGSDYSVAYQRGLLLRTTTDGDSLWMRTYFYQDTAITEGTGRFWDVIQTDDGGFIACGWALGQAGGNTPPGYSQDTWVVKVDSMGCIIPGCDATGVTEIITNLSDALTVYPNPAHGHVQVGITLPSSLRNGQDLQLTFVSASGQVALVHAAHEGSNEVNIQALASGLYYVHLSNEKTWISGSKLVVE